MVWGVHGSRGVHGLGGAWFQGGAWSWGVIWSRGDALSRKCLVETPPQSYCCGRYTSYWNAFLFCEDFLYLLGVMYWT